MEAKVYRRDGSEAGRTVELEESIFGIEPNDHAIWLDVRRIQASARQGTHKSKERSETAGSTRKLYRQKGTGNARAGDAKSPIRRSGGTIFGPRPRTYGIKVNRKTQALARRSALAHKAREEAIRLLEDVQVDAPSTRALASMLGGLGVNGNRVLVLTAENSPALYRSARNIDGVAVREVRNVSTLDLMQARVVLIEEGALDRLNEQLGRTASEASAE